MKDCVRKVNCREDASSGGQVPLDSSGELDFLRERLALFSRATLLACVGFFVAGFAIEALWPPRAGAVHSFSRPDVLFHLAACSVLAVMWLATRQPGLSERALLILDSAGTVATLALFACMTANMPSAWRPETLFLLIVIVILLTRASLVPSRPATVANG